MKKYLLSMSLLLSTQAFSAVHTAPTVFNKTFPAFMAELAEDKDPVITILWQGDGGYVNEGIMFINFIQIKEISQKIIFKLVGPSYSMHSNVICYATNVEYNEQVLMFHPIAATDPDTKRQEVLNDPETVKEAKELLQPCVEKGILTPDELHKALTTSEVYTGFTKDGSKVTAIMPDPRQEPVRNFHQAVLDLLAIPVEL